jgi:hypothetical protein
MISGLQLLLVYSYGLPLFLINLRIVYVIWTNKKHISFVYFKLFFLCGCNDIILYVVNNLFTRLPSYEPLFDNVYSKLGNHWWLGFGMFISQFCMYFTHLGMFFLSLNRFTSLTIFMTYETVSNLNLNNTYIIDVEEEFEIRFCDHVWDPIYDEFQKSSL